MTKIRIEFEADHDEAPLVLEYDTRRGDNFFFAHVNQFGVLEHTDTDELSEVEHFGFLTRAIVDNGYQL